MYKIQQKSLNALFRRLAHMPGMQPPNTVRFVAGVAWGAGVR